MTLNISFFKKSTLLALFASKSNLLHMMFNMFGFLLLVMSITERESFPKSIPKNINLFLESHSLALSIIAFTLSIICQSNYRKCVINIRDYFQDRFNYQISKANKNLLGYDTYKAELIEKKLIGIYFFGNALPSLFTILLLSILIALYNIKISGIFIASLFFSISGFLILHKLSLKTTIAKSENDRLFQVFSAFSLATFILSFFYLSAAYLEELDMNPVIILFLILVMRIIMGAYRSMMLGIQRSLVCYQRLQSISAPAKIDFTDVLSFLDMLDSGVYFLNEEINSEKYQELMNFISISEEVFLSKRTIEGISINMYLIHGVNFIVDDIYQGLARSKWNVAIEYMNSLDEKFVFISGNIDKQNKYQTELIKRLK